ncbi:hypothetical protein FJZ53_07335, partial [Candidatus Woesearchaeota archaeon]|nr:hypothetical protein [Candidatus Woesearchaeota archaeon]
MNLEFFPLDTDFDNKANAIRIFGRTKDGKKVILLDSSVKDYFWVIPKKGASKLAKSMLGLKFEDEEGKAYKVLKAEVKKMKYFDEEIEAIQAFLENPGDKRIILDLISQLKDIDSRKEVDISLKKRYWSEKGIQPLTLCEAECEEKKGVIRAKKIIPKKESYDNPKLLAFDIETYAPIGRYSIPEKDPIMTIAVYSPGLKKVLTWKKFYTGNESIIFKDSE